ncbi:MAG TPA: TonB-dependent receptor [Anaeromyxobacteraceae bacterium]|nr:TonB-dependent receptor [Anaeromyxobacteraceae bacterium]
MEEQVVRLPRAEAAGDPTAAATVVEASRFEGEAKGVAQLVATAPGVAVNDYGGLGQLTTISIRGSTADGVLVLLDGLPLNTAFGGGVDLSSIPRGWIERVEVVRGPEGAYYGAGALGGVVNVITRPARAGAWSVEASGGSFGSAALAADAAVPAGGGTLLVAAGGEATGGRFPYRYDATPTLPGDALQERERVNDASRRGGGLLKLSRPALDGRLDAFLQVSAGHRGLPGFAAAPTPDDWQEDGRVLAMARLARPGPGASTVALRTHARFDWLDVRVGDPTPYRQRGGGGGAAGELSLPHPSGLLTALVDVSGEGVQADALGADRTRLSAAAAVADDLSLAGGRLRLAPALRADVVGGFAGVSGKLGLAWRLGEVVALHAGVGRSFRAPSLAELHFQQGAVLPNPDLVPESGLAVDAALVADGPLGLASLGGHVTRYRDLILYEPTSLGRLEPQNAGQALVSGLEAELATAPLLGPARASLSGAYTLLLTEILQGAPGEAGNWIPYRPRHRLYARAAAAPGPLEAHVEAHYVGLRYQDRRNLRPVPATLLWNAGASVRLWGAPAVRLHLDVKNLLDDRTLTDGLGNPLPSRMVMVTLRAGSPTTEGTP